MKLFALLLELRMVFIYDSMITSWNTNFDSFFLEILNGVDVNIFNIRF
jgi:hypothetical protein